jgi:hypothetical protein
MMNIRFVQLYTGLTLTYGSLFAYSREYHTGLAVTSIAAAPFIWPVLVMEDFMRMRNKQIYSSILQVR